MRVILAALTVEVALAPRLRRGRLLRPGAGGSPEPSFGRKLFRLAHASNSVPSTEKCSLDNNPLTLSCDSTAARNWAAISPSSSRSRFLVKVVASHTGSSMPSPTNQRNSRS